MRGEHQGPPGGGEAVRRARRGRRAAGFNSHHYQARCRSCRCRRRPSCRGSSQTVWHNLRREHIDEAAAAAAARPAAARRARADRRAEPDPARRVRHQGEPHLRPGAGRRGRGQRRPAPVHLRRAGHAQPAQAGPRVRAARQHLLLRHPQRRRPPVEHDGHRHRLHGEARSPASRAATRTAWARTKPTPWPTRPPASSGTTRCATAISIRNYGEFMAPTRPLARPAANRRRRTSSPATAPGSAKRRGHLRERADDRDAPALLADRLRGLGDWPCPTSTGPTSYLRELRAVRGTRRVPAARDHLPAERPHQRHEARARPRRRRWWPTTTWPSAASSRR